jgi:hypothetical protein
VLQDLLDLVGLWDTQATRIAQGEAKQCIGGCAVFGFPPLHQGQGDIGATNQQGPHVAQALIDRELLLGADAQRLIELPAAVQDVGDATLKGSAHETEKIVR